MAAPKRKSPRKTPARKEPGFVSVAALAMGQHILRHPKLVGGSAAFFVVFGFVAANALWYQPGHHPSPFLRTRDEENPNGIPGYRVASDLGENGNVTTFRIERPGDAPQAPSAPAATQPADVASVITQSEPQATAHQPSELVAEIQRELARRGLYEGPADGMPGPRTTAAILFFEETVGMEQTGEPTSRVLSAMKIDSATTVAAIPKALPKDRPAEPNSGGVAIDPVAAAIRNADAQQPKPQSVSLTSGNAPKPAQKDLVAKIQQGLVNIAYADVKVDGVPGEQTRTAIRNFEKHYRLPETGEPSEAVLKKLKSIGAL
ncbi:peptidoglycan-binding protein [Rhizobium skierniewicense]|uniref:peptidoglycan-binding domain-containing protein n=1 Tax=Rhizobium skierniewicense TaxID=984260 RepID=UPI001573C48A|nr:peptidoglycan-binding domain-containing protein [Rhizobium skierniewicense]NTF31214.1 peptidoglycan-binding protein [Rhizobium skierniewicense]